MRFFRRHKTEETEYDPYTGSQVRKGWVAERQAIMDDAVRRIESGEENGGTCAPCGLPIRLHPLPERMWRNDPAYCLIAKQNAEGKQ